MELEKDNLGSNNDDSAPMMHLCDLPDEIIIIIFQYMFSLGALNIGAVRYALKIRSHRFRIHRLRTSICGLV